MTCSVKVSVPWWNAYEYCRGWDEIDVPADELVKKITGVVERESGRFVIMDRWEDIMPYEGYVYIVEIPSDDVVRMILEKVEAYCVSSMAEKMLKAEGLEPRFKGYCGAVYTPRRDDIVLLVRSLKKYLVWYL